MKDITVQSNLKALGGVGAPGSLDAKKSGKPDGDGPSFADTLADSLNKVNDLQKKADEAIEDFATGETRNIHETMIAVNKADLAFRLTMQVRNKIVEAYQEVMRTQV
ncbi:flagellar hook-basal body complex protein FliE [Candidatus Nitromaritima sp. SCGC AAA799-C22]|nr:flagellar hook-basal body complex protein FliE [Candidatus Nitromaritima sp. SCGC AAA799-C22]